MGIITKNTYRRRKRKEVYVVVRKDLTIGLSSYGNEEPVRAFTTIKKARDYMNKLRTNLSHLIVDEEAYGGVFADEFGIKEWTYVIRGIELDTEYGEQIWISHIPAFKDHTP